MKENNIEYSENGNSSLTYTRRKQNMGSIQQRQHNTQINPRIFKYPYLVSRSSEKVQQDNVSNKSTEKARTRNPYRRKIFQGKSAIFEDRKVMKQSIHSVDAKRKNAINQFGFNPIQSKLRNNSKSKKSFILSTSQQNSFTKPIPMKQSFQKSNPVVFHYSSPPPQIPVNSLPPYHMQSTNSFPNAQVQILNYPSTYQSTFHHYTSYPVPQNSVIYHHKPQSYFLPNPTHIKSQVQLLRKPISTEIDYIKKSPNNAKYLAKNPSPSNFAPQVTPPFSPSIQKNMSPNKSSSVNTKPILFRSISINNNIEEGQRQIMGRNRSNTIKMNEERKSLFKQYVEVKQKQNVTKNMVQTFPIGQKFRKSNKQSFKVSVRNNSSQKLKQKVHFTPQMSQSSFPLCNKDDHEVDIQEIEELDVNFDELDNYSDRFFDMDFQQNKNKQMNHTQKNATQPFSITKFSSSKDIKQKTQNPKKKGTITSIKLSQKQKSSKLNDSDSNQVSPIKNKSIFKIKTQQMFSKLDKQGKLITIFLIGLGILLVVYQILK